ncbi:MAG TPA: heavy metal-associated domain-containing protein [Armatimonadota bacterium]|jgi:copper chaperone CopZ
MMRKGILGVLIAIVVLSVAAIALAAKPKAPQLTPVTVAVDGLHCQACVDELQKDLGKAPGVSDVKVTQKPGQVTAKLDESTITVSQFVTLITTHPQAMDHDKTYGAKLMAYIDTEMCAKNAKMCDGCFTEIPKVLNAVKGVSDVTLDETGKIAAIGFTKDANVTTSALATALGKSNFKFHATFVSPTPQTTQKDQAGGGCNMDMGNMNMGSGGGSCH